MSINQRAVNSASLSFLEMISALVISPAPNAADCVAIYAEWIASHQGDPHLAAAWFNLGSVASNAGDVEKAASTYAKALRLKPDLRQAATNLGLHHERSGSSDLAIKTRHDALPNDQARTALLALGHDDASALRARIVDSFDTFASLENLSDEDAAPRIAADEVDILIDLNGLTRGGRVQILRQQPAPVQATCLQFVGPIYRANDKPNVARSLPRLLGQASDFRMKPFCSATSATISRSHRTYSGHG